MVSAFFTFCLQTQTHHCLLNNPPPPCERPCLHVFKSVVVFDLFLGILFYYINVVVIYLLFHNSSKEESGLFIPLIFLFLPVKVCFMHICLYREKNRFGREDNECGLNNYPQMVLMGPVLFSCPETVFMAYPHFMVYVKMFSSISIQGSKPDGRPIAQIIWKKIRVYFKSRLV